MDTEFILGLFDSEKQRARELFVEFDLHGDEDDKAFLDEPGRKTRDDEATEIIKRVAGVRRCTDLADMSKDQRDCALLSLKREGLTVRQLARLTGINRGIIQKAK